MLKQNTLQFLKTLLTGAKGYLIIFCSYLDDSQPSIMLWISRTSTSEWYDTDSVSKPAKYQIWYIYILIQNNLFHPQESFGPTSKYVFLFPWIICFISILKHFRLKCYLTRLHWYPVSSDHSESFNLARLVLQM